MFLASPAFLVDYWGLMFGKWDGAPSFIWLPLPPWTPISEAATIDGAEDYDGFGTSPFRPFNHIIILLVMNMGTC